MIRQILARLPLIALALVVLASLVLTNYRLTLVTYVMIYAIVCIALVLMTGVVGMVSFGQAAFVGIGAYATAYLTAELGLSPWLGLLVALTACGVAAYLIGQMTVRMSGHYLALVTLCFCISVYFLIGNTEVLGKFNGMTGIPPLSIAGYEMRSERSIFYVVLSGLALTSWWVRRILKGRVGRGLRSLRTGGLIAETFGVDANALRMMAFVSAAMLAGFSGWLYAHFQRFVNPTPFGVQMSIEYLFMVVIGGVGHIWGAILGAGLVTVIKQELQDVLRPFLGETTRLDMLVFSTLMVFMLIVARQGIWPLVVRAFAKWMPRPKPVMAIEIGNRRVMPPPQTVVLEAVAMRKTFGGLVAVDDVSFSISAGEVLGLLGPNGAGKSTLFNLITGVLPLSSGGIRLFAKELSVVDVREMCRRGVARTFQHVKLVPDMTLIENVAIGAASLGQKGLLGATFGLDRAEEQRILGWSMHLLQRVGLASRAWDLAGSLPLGHQRVLEIARALAADPFLLLLDEPAAGLRANEKTELAALLRSLRNSGLAILLVEHDMEFVASIADRLMVMNFGRRIAMGHPDSVRADPMVQDAYLGAAA
ncbi:MAG: branched-chain amino acid ABC transporter ATP-binding protein/permease [Xanthobacteraceae bacterium]|nr:MAG: branched-chain amino acid ABC transporter ATP-binding protein/permease [Xanthobacteraceae bacterium]